MGSIQIVETTDNELSITENTVTRVVHVLSNVTLTGGGTEVIENTNGAALSGNNGDANRVLTLSNISLSSNEKVIQDRNALHPTNDYTVSHLAASSTITFLTRVWNDQDIRVLYLT